MTEQSKTFQKRTSLTLRYNNCPGAIQQLPSNGFRGAVEPPELKDISKVHVFPLFPDEDGINNPIGHPYEGSLQIEITATKAGYRELARYLLAFSELDISANPSHHEHHNIINAEGKTKIKLIFRKAE